MKENLNVRQMRAMLTGQPMSETKMSLPVYCQAMNEQTFSKPNYCGMKQPCRTTFAYDLGCYPEHCETTNELKTSIELYLSKIRPLIKGNKERYCELVNAFNKCSWGCYDFGYSEGFVNVFADYYLKFMYNRKTALEFLSENDWEYVRTYLD